MRTKVRDYCIIEIVIGMIVQQLTCSRVHAFMGVKIQAFRLVPGMLRMSQKRRVSELSIQKATCNLYKVRSEYSHNGMKPS